MCGIFGFIDCKPEQSAKDMSQRAHKMQQSLKHRGPDGNGVAYISNGFIGNTRLSIIDVEGGQQPFFSKDRDIIVVQNGEIFNYKDLINNLKKEGLVFDSSSDTEVILRMYEKYGINFISFLQGMFAISIIDLRISKMFLIRDRVGEKPLFYSSSGNQFVFSSEINSILPFINNKKISQTSLISYLRFNYVPQPATIFDNIFSVKPGFFIEVDLNLSVAEKHIQWWSILNDGTKANFESKISKDEIIERLRNSIKKRLTSDVDVSLLLSGGIDSSLIGYLLNEVDRNLDSYTIYFNDESDSDLQSAKQLSLELGLKQNIIQGKSEFRKWSSILNKLGQPFGDTSFISLNEISSHVGSSFKVAITGDGADEIFGGYLNYSDLNDIKKNVKDSNSLIKEYLNRNSVFDNHDIESILNIRHGLYDEIVESTIHNSTNGDLKNNIYKINDTLSKYLFLDVSLLLPSNNLFKSDMCSMFNQLELRSPFLELDMLEVFFNINESDRINVSSNKSVLRQYLKSQSERFSNLPKRKFVFPFIDSFNADSNLFFTLIKKLPSYFPIFRIEGINELIEKYNSNPKIYYRKVRNLLALAIWVNSIENSINYD